MPLVPAISRFGGLVGDWIERFGNATLFSLATFHSVFFGVRTWGRWPRLATQLYLIGSKSVPVLALTGAVIGAILAIEGYDQFAAFGQEQRLGGAVNLSIVKQIGPVLAAVMLAGRVGCSLTAELGSMRVTEQIDAMRVMAADPIRVLVAPRFVACILMIPALTVVSNICGVFGGWLITTQFFAVDQTGYWEFTRYFINWFEVFNGMVKSLFFGGVIALIACYKGFNCRSGAQGVGQATTEAFVASFVAIVVLNLVLAKFLNDVDSLRRSLLGR